VAAGLTAIRYLGRQTKLRQRRVRQLTRFRQQHGEILDPQEFHCTDPGAKLHRRVAFQWKRVSSLCGRWSREHDEFPCLSNIRSSSYDDGRVLDTNGFKITTNLISRTVRRWLPMGTDSLPCGGLASFQQFHADIFRSRFLRLASVAIPTEFPGAGSILARPNTCDEL